MRRLIPWLTLALFLLPALQPYLAGDFPRTNDAATHLYRAFELDRLARAGVVLPRWGPDFAHGYGYPTFHYFPYLSHYLIEFGHLAGLPLLWAMRLAFSLALAGAGVTAYLLGRDLWGEAGGLAAGLAYVYSPYLLYTANVRGGLPESVMLALLPLALLALRRLAAGQRRWLPAGVLAVAGMTFSHLGGLVQVSPFVGLFAAVCVLEASRKPPGTSLKPPDPSRKETRAPIANNQLPVTNNYGLRIASRSRNECHAERSEASRATNEAQLLLNREILGALRALRMTFRDVRITHYVLHSALPAAAILLGLALPAFQWLPARAELDAVRFAEGFSRAGIVYSLNFARPAELFALPRLPVDLGLLNPPVARPLPLVALALAVLCALRWRGLRPEARRWVLFFGFVLLASVFLALDWSRIVWDNIPLLQQTLWPWRYLAPASLAAAMLAGGAIGTNQKAQATSHKSQAARGKVPDASGHTKQAQVANFRLRITDYGLRVTHYALRFTSYVSRFARYLSQRPYFLLPLIVLTALPWLYPPREALPEAPTLADLAQAEIPPLLVGTTTTGEYTPVGVQTWPDTAAMRAEQLAGRDPERLDFAALPEGAAATATVRNPLGVTYLLTLPRAAVVVYRTLFFPGWQAALDGRPLALRPTAPDGLIAFDVPAGQHALTLRFADTPVRRLAGGISLAALGLLAVAVADWVIGRATARGKGLGVSQPSAVSGHAVLAAAVLLLAKLLLLDTGIVPLARPGAPRMAHPLGADFGGELALAGYDLPRAAIPADGAFALNLYWQAQRDLGVPYGMGVRLVDERGVAWSSGDIQRPPDFRFFPGTDNWPPGQYVLDPYLIEPVYGTPPGEYQLEVVAYRQSDLQAIGKTRIGPVNISAPSRAQPAGSPEAAFPAGPALLSHSIDRAAAAPGDPVLLRLTWQAAQNLPGDLRARLELWPGGAQEAVFVEEFLVGGGYPTSRWRPGEVLTDQPLLRLPASLETGAYTWTLTVLDGSGQPLGEAVTLAVGFQVSAPPRTFDVPALAHPAEALLGGIVRLWGYNLSAEAAQPGDSITVSLVWGALAETPVSYHVFLHLIDPATGAIVAQSDGAPAGWTRPTTGWVAGEVVVDARALALPPDLRPGEYALWAGMADSDTGQRLAVQGTGDDRVRLGVLEVTPP